MEDGDGDGDGGWEGLVHDAVQYKISWAMHTRLQSKR